MFDLPAALAATERDFDAIISQLDGLAGPEWGAPVRCAGWQITDLAVHIIGASRGQAEGLRRAAAGISDMARLDPPAEREPRALMAALKDGQGQLLAALRDLPPPALDGTVPLPFGLLPAAVALQIVPLEYGFHRNDLDWALGRQVPLSDDVAATLVGIVPGLLPMLASGTPVSAAGTPPPGPVAYRLVTPAALLLAGYDGTAWSIGPGADNSPVTCEISGDDSSVALFVMGRIGAGHPRLAVTDAATAGAFKSYFPGP
jgi:uncharacterized protein (TIGR03083 family)